MRLEITSQKCLTLRRQRSMQRFDMQNTALKRQGHSFGLAGSSNYTERTESEDCRKVISGTSSEQKLDRKKQNLFPNDVCSSVFES